MATVRDLYTAMALPPLPMHFTVFLRHGGVAAGTMVLQAGQVVAMDDDCVTGMVQWSIAQGVDSAAARGAKLPLPPELHAILKEVDGKPKPKGVLLVAPASRRAWREGLERIRSGENLPHADRFRLLMSMLRAGWDDDAIHREFMHAPNYSSTKTQGFVDHARRKYMGE